MRMNPLMLCMLLMSVSHAHDLFGQDIGQRVRVTVEDDVMIGTVTSASGNSFDINLQDGGSHSVMYRDIARMERSLGIRTYKKRGFLIGFGAGAVVGGLTGYFAMDVGCVIGTLGLAPCDFEEKMEGAIVSGVISGGIVGLGGLIAGEFVKREAWASVRVPSASGRLRIDPMIDVVLARDRNPGIVVGARVTF